METITGGSCYAYGDAWSSNYTAPEYASGYELSMEGCSGAELSLPVLSSLSMGEVSKQCMSQWYYYPHHNEDFIQGNIRPEDFVFQHPYVRTDLGGMASVGGHLHHNLHPTTIARRNERERNRVKTINSTFAKLRQHLPCSAKNKKLSKVQILRSAIHYINQLQHILDTQQQRKLSDGDKSPVDVKTEAEDGDSQTTFHSDTLASECEDTRHVSAVSPTSLHSVTSSRVSSYGDDGDDQELLGELCDWMKQ